MTNATHFIEQYIDRDKNLYQTKPLPIDKLPVKVNAFKKSEFKTIAFWKIRQKNNA